MITDPAPTSSPALMVWELWCFEDLEEKDRSVNQLSTDRGVCRTAPATPGLLIILEKMPGECNILLFFQVMHFRRERNVACRRELV